MAGSDTGPRTRLATLGAACVLALSPSGAAHAAAPTSMAALGDSFTTAAFTGAPCAVTSNLCPANSWSTGTNAAVVSHYARLRAIEPRITGQNFTYAASARKVSDLQRQASAAVARHVQYATILIGLNDACRESEAAMTPVATFRSQFAAGLGTLARGLPGGRILVASIPDPERLRVLFKGDAIARSKWAAQAVCQVFFANPLSTATADVARRARARQRVVDFNRQLQQVCALYANCRYDGGAVFNWIPTRAQILTRDYFHPSVAGQAALSARTWAAGYRF